jgi:quercetin dioxygenase-like cupin family protein
MGATVHRPGEGEHIGGPTSVTIKANAQDTGGSLYVGEVVAEPGFAGPPPHVHDRMHDMFYVLEGTLTVRVGDDPIELRVGGFACAPPGVVHTFSNPGSEPVRFLNLSTPGGWEGYMRELGAVLGNGAVTPEQIGEIASRYDFRAV